MPPNGFARPLPALAADLLRGFPLASRGLIYGGRRLLCFTAKCWAISVMMNLWQKLRQTAGAARVMMPAINGSATRPVEISPPGARGPVPWTEHTAFFLLVLSCVSVCVFVCVLNWLRHPFRYCFFCPSSRANWPSWRPLLWFLTKNHWNKFLTNQLHCLDKINHTPRPHKLTKLNDRCFAISIEQNRTAAPQRADTAQSKSEAFSFSAILSGRPRWCPFCLSLCVVYPFHVLFLLPVFCHMCDVFPHCTCTATESKFPSWDNNSLDISLKEEKKKSL